MSNTSLIQIKDISKSYTMGNETIYALNRINLSIESGEYIAILGPSGSGKSTLMNILGCLDTPTEGHYYLQGKDVSYLPRNEKAVIRNKTIGFIFQSFNLLPYGSALDNVALPLLYRGGVSTKERQERARTTLEQVGLGHRLHHRPSELSGGQRQRVAIARALVTQPEMILADEPTGNLDTQSGEAVIKLFEGLIAEGKTIIVVTHDLSVAKRTKRIIEIRDGQLSA